MYHMQLDELWGCCADLLSYPELKRNLMRITIFATRLLAGLSVREAAWLDRFSNPATGPFYSLLTSNTWTGAQAEAVGIGGNLTTIDNAAENDWVFDTFSLGPVSIGCSWWRTVWAMV